MTYSNDIDNFNDDFKLSKHHSTKLNINSRSLSVYERYLEKNIEDKVAREGRIAAKESLLHDIDSESNVSTVETVCEPIINKTDKLTKNAPSTAVSDSDKLYISEGSVNKTKGSHTKIAFISTVSTLAITAIIITLLNITGFFSTTIAPLNTNKSSKLAVIEPTVTTTPINAGSAIKPMVATAVAPETSVEPIIIRNDNVSTQDSNLLVDSHVDDMILVKTVAAETEEANISYNEFREEAQNTLYRESKN